MSQEPYKNDKKRALPKFNRPSGDSDNNSPRKGPRFSFYWVYAIIFVVLIGFQLFGSFNPNAAQISQNQFEEMIRRGEVQEYTIISNRNLVKVNLNKENLSEATRKEVSKNAAG
ncbi:MAG TPA: ATP-dependent metallopeptidase FtsH/Yme1/Tma family protein, partial [Flavisolibacter sp.]|nr:ATP-dependent metallopeptidase FtsH/Yme1/Tma family protein [Flavisolibacter sp.]